MSQKYKHTGDTGITRLLDGQKLNKNDLYFHVLGDIDELNSFIGYSFIIIKDNINDIIDYLQKIQKLLIYYSGIIASPKKTEIVLDKKHILELEKNTETIDSLLPKLTKFLLPNKESSYFHILRTITRRCERGITDLFLKNNNENNLNIILIFFNRLSDYFFVLSRYISSILNIDEIEYNNIL